MVYTLSDTQQKDAYSLEDTSIPNGSTINSVTAHFTVKGQAQPFLRLSEVETEGSLKSNESPSYGGTITAIVSDNTYIYAAGASTNTIRKYNKSDLSLVAESPSYGGTIYALASDDTYIYAGGDTTNTVRRYYKSDLSYTNTQTASYGGAIRALVVDNTYIYAAGATTNTIRKYNKSDLSYTNTQTASYGSTIRGLTSDDNYIYAAGQTTNKVRKYNKSDLSLVAESASYGGHIYALTSDADYIYAAGGTIYTICKYNKSDLSLVAESPSYGSYILALTSDDTYIYAGGDTTQTVRRYNKLDMSYTGLQSASYGGTIYTLASNADYIYAAGATTQTVRKYNKSDMSYTNLQTSDYGDSIFALASDDDHIYAAGVNRNIRKYNKSDMSYTNLQSASYGGVIYTLTSDANYIYAAGGTIFTIRKYNKSDLSYTNVESASYGGTIYALTSDDDYIYAAGETTQTIRKYNKSDLSLVAESPSYGGIIRALTSDDDYIYAGGITTKTVRKYSKLNMSFVSKSADCGDSIFALVSDNDHIYVAGGLTNYFVKKYYKSNFYYLGQTISYGNTIWALTLDNDYIYAGGATILTVKRYSNKFVGFENFSESLSKPGGGTWTVSDLNDLQLVIGLKAQKTDAFLTQAYIEVNYTLSDNNAPNSPILISPSDGSYTSSSTPTLSANYSDNDEDDTGTTKYGIATSAENCLTETFVSSGASSETNSNNENTTWTPSSSIGADGTYYWCAQNDDGELTSAWTTMGSFILDTTPPSTPIADPAAGTYTEVQSVSLSSAGSSAIYYTTNGDEPTTGSTLYSSAIAVNSSMTIKALAVDTSGNESSVLSAAYVINLDPDAPVISGVNSTPSTDSAIITWTTDEDASSQVEYGPTSAYGTTSSETDISSRVTSHSVTVNSLISCAQYFYRVKSKDAAENQGVSAQATFFTTGCDASSVSNGNSEAVEVSGGTVSLNTDNGTATITAPNNYASETTTIQISKLGTSSAPAAPSGTNLVDDNFFNLLAVSVSGSVVETFDQLVSFIVNYGTEVESVYKESTLDIYKYTGGNWVDQNCTLDIGANTLTCSLSGFSVYGVFGRAISGGSTFGSSSSSSSGPSSTVCSDSKPVGAPDLFQVDTTQTQATLYFTPISGNTKYYIAFSTKDNAEEHGVEVMLGSEGVQNFTVNLLSSSTTYYFKVRGQNGCMPGDWSNIKSAKTKDYYSAEIMNREIELEKAEPEEKEGPGIHTQAQEPLLANRCTHVVKSGDTLWGIAKEIYNDATLYPEVIKNNENKYHVISQKLDVGWELNFPCKEENKDVVETISPTPEKESEKQGVGQLLGNKMKKRISDILFSFGQKTQDVSDSIGYAIVNLGYKFIDEPTKIYEVKTIVQSPTSVTISWKTNQPATGKVNYGLDKTYPFDSQLDKRTTNHEFTLSNLEPNTLYFFEVMSQAKTYVYDANREFRTMKE